MWKLMDLDWLLAAEPHQRSFFPKGIQCNSLIDWRLQTVWMWICVWARSVAQEEIQPAAFRLVQEYCSFSSSMLGSSHQSEAVLQTCFVTLLDFGNGGKWKTARNHRTSQKGFPNRGFSYGTKVQKCSYAEGLHKVWGGTQKDREKCPLLQRWMWFWGEDTEVSRTCWGHFREGIKV